MQTSMTEVRLYGELGKKFGKKFKFNIVNPRDALSALRANFPEFTEYLIKNNEPGYYVFVGGKSIGSTEFKFPAGREPISIVPIVKGAKKSPVWTILIGVALVAIGGPLGLLGTGALATAVVGIGVSLALNGISALLAGNPGGGPEERGQNRPSSFFSGPVNTIQQGGAVPLVFGRVIAGSAVISAGIKTQTVDKQDSNCTQSGIASTICEIAT